MNAESARKFEALEAQARDILATFTGDGYEAVAPAIIQPADIFLDVIGEDLRGRTYVFTDQEGSELCLRPDLTVPTCRLHWERHGRADAQARYCYNGPAFRFQPNGGDATHPREFRQAGIEHFGLAARDKAETEVLSTIVKALGQAQVEEYEIRCGDLGLFNALLDAIDMPERWRGRLKSQFWQPAAFREELQRLVKSPGSSADGLPDALLGQIIPGDAKASERAIETYMHDHGIELIGARTVSEIAANIMNMVEDGTSDALPASVAELISNYLGVSAPARAAGARLRDLMQSAKLDISGALDVYQRRLQRMADAGIDIGKLKFSAEFGRNLEYYTGFVFEVTAPTLGEQSPIAGGGRYDRLMRSVGSTVDVPAMGAMIHTERLLSVVRGEV
ncbi:MAG: ATP phosphoribosyltransferase regulatory subunit [Hyphomicrobiaceae bacterium]|jgi:ATP phosphoribosyltransferase regulatory subunit